MMKNSPKTRLALIGTMSDLHSQPISYDLHTLHKIVTDLAPDLLCAEITKEAWEDGDITGASLELRAALVPAVETTDIVLVPIAPSTKQFADFSPLGGWRQRLIQIFDRFLRWGQGRADTAEAINGAWFGLFCHSVCDLTEMFWSKEDRQAWEKQNRLIVENIVNVVEHNAASRILVAVQCQRLHQLIPMLEKHAHLFDLVGFQNL
jgi:hypothetical protein